MALLRIKKISLRLGERNILDGLDLELERGEIHTLLGANGAGKSSLAYALMGCEGYLPDAGEVLFEDKPILGLAMHERARLGLSLAWQEPAKFEGLSIADFLALGGRGDNPASCLAAVGLEPAQYLPRPLDRTLSGGERKRVELAGVLALRPKLAILDEPTAGIDMLSIETVENAIRALREQGATVLVITHDEQVVYCTDRASQLCGGRILFQGKPEEVVKIYKSRSCRRCDGDACDYA
jgi:Fe-S cluster assembly ATP-binding protein